LGRESHHLESRLKAAAKLDLEAAAEWPSPSSRGLWVLEAETLAWAGRREEYSPAQEDVSRDVLGPRRQPRGELYVPTPQLTRVLYAGLCSQRLHLHRRRRRRHVRKAPASIRFDARVSHTRSRSRAVQTTLNTRIATVYAPVTDAECAMVCFCSATLSPAAVSASASFTSSSTPSSAVAAAATLASTVAMYCRRIVVSFSHAPCRPGDTCTWVTRLILMKPQAPRLVVYSDVKVANRTIRVWHGATENGLTRYWRRQGAGCL
jgi:hypothetical protein